MGSSQSLKCLRMTHNQAQGPGLSHLHGYHCLIEKAELGSVKSRNGRFPSLASNPSCQCSFRIDSAAPKEDVAVSHYFWVL